MDSNGSLCAFTGPYAFLWIIMRPYRFICVLMDSNGFSWVHRGPHASFWILMGPYGSLCVICVLLCSYVF